MRCFPGSSAQGAQKGSLEANHILFIRYIFFINHSNRLCKKIQPASDLEPSVPVAMLRQELATVSFSQAIDHRQHVIDSINDLSRASDVGVELVEHAQHCLADFRVAGDCLRCLYMSAIWTTMDGT